MFVSPSHELQLIKGIGWLKSICLHEAHRGHLKKHYLLGTALAESDQKTERESEREKDLIKPKHNKLSLQMHHWGKKKINQHLTDIIWCKNQQIR